MVAAMVSPRGLFIDDVPFGTCGDEKISFFSSMSEKRKKWMVVRLWVA